MAWKPRGSHFQMKLSYMELVPCLKSVPSVKKGFYLGSEAEVGVVGTLLVTYEWSDWRNGWFWWIQSVYIDGNWRREGIYTTLFEEVQTRSQKADSVFAG